MICKPPNVKKIIRHNISLLHSLYRAMLGASLAITIEHPPVTSLGDILQSDYKLHVGKGNSVEKLFLEANKRTIYGRVVKSGKLVSEVPNERDIFKRIVNGSLSERTLFFGVYQPIRSLPEWSCSMSSVKTDYRKVGNGLVLQKNWKFADIVNSHLLRLKEDGILGEIREKYQRKKDSICKGHDIMPASLAETMSLYILIAIGFTASLLFFCFEVVYIQYFKQ